MQTAFAPCDREQLIGAGPTGRWDISALPPEMSAYLAHTEGGIGIRAIARLRDCPPSTILRQIRRVETRRDDPLLDSALSRAAALVGPFDGEERCHSEDWAKMIAREKQRSEDLDETVKREARRILRRLCEKDAFLAVAEGMEKAAVLRESVPGRHTRTAVLDREVAQQFALRDWVERAGSGRVARYAITEAGRAALKRLLEEERQARGARDAAGGVTPFRAQHQEWGERLVMQPDGGGEKRLRYNLAESPLTVLGRKRDRDGEAFLSADLVDAGERLREDFELAQMGPRITQNWDSFLAPCDGPPMTGRGPAEGPQAARARGQSAVAALGPGLSDVVLRVCCFLEGLEAAEKRLGWSARSGKVVLRIALQRLALHYGIAPEMPARRASGG